MPDFLRAPRGSRGAIFCLQLLADKMLAMLITQEDMCSSAEIGTFLKVSQNLKQCNYM